MLDIYISDNIVSINSPVGRFLLRKFNLFKIVIFIFSIYEKVNFSRLIDLSYVKQEKCRYSMIYCINIVWITKFIERGVTSAGGAAARVHTALKLNLHIPF